jgi:hypothetical protein
LTIKASFALLLSIYPLAIVNFFGRVSEPSISVFFSFLVLSIILRSIRPSKLPLAVELSIQPGSFIHGIIRVCRGAFTFRGKRFQIQIALILPSILVLDSGLDGRVIVEMNCKGLARVFLVVDNELASSWP